MGMLVEGEWGVEGLRADVDGRFVRSTTTFKDRVPPAVRAASRPRRAATTSTSRRPARGHTGRRSCAN